MAKRFEYSRWDGTQTGFEFDADAAFDELTDELLYHGDVNAALRRMMQEGMTDRNGEQMQGLRELLEQLRAERQQRLENSDLGGVYDEIKDQLDDIIDEERHAIDNARRDAENSGDERRAQNAQAAADERNMRLDLMPDDLAGKVRELDAYNFESKEAKQRFDQLMEQLKEQLMQQMVDQMSGAMQNMSPEDMARMKDMMAALNEMLEKHQRGEDPGFEQFMEEYGDFFPENPETVEELLEQMAKRMAAMQAMMNSMTPEQRAQLQQLSDQLMEDMDLQWQMQQLSGNLQQMFPQLNWNESYDFEGQDPMGFQQAMQAMQDMGDLDQLENLLRNASSPGALAEADMDRVRDLMGDDAAKSLERLAELTKMLEQAGLIEQKEGRLEMTPKGLRKIGSNALRDLFSKLAKDTLGQHDTSNLGQGHERTYDTKAYEYGDPFQLDLNRTIRNALRRSGGGYADPTRPGRLRDRTHRAPHSVVDGADARPVAVDADARQLPARQEGGDGVAQPDHVAVPPRLPRHRRLLRDRPSPHRRAVAGGVVGLRVRHQHASRLHAGAQAVGPRVGYQADHHDHRRRADGAHHGQRHAVLQLPAGARDGRGHAA